MGFIGVPKANLKLKIAFVIFVYSLVLKNKNEHKKQPHYFIG